MKKLILTQMASDKRIPPAAMGYIADLQSGSLSSRIKKDRLNQLRKYIPELVKEYENQ